MTSLDELAQVAEHVIGLTLGIAAGVTDRDRHALVAICADDVMTERAIRYVLHHILRTMASEREPTGEAYRAIVVRLCALAREH